MISRFFGTSNPFRLSPGWKIVSYVILGLWSIVILFPLYWLLITAFKAPEDVANGPKYIPFVDFQPTTAQWTELLADPSAGQIANRPYYNTFVVGTTSAFLSLVVGSSAAYALVRFRYRVKVGVIFTIIGCVILGIVLLSLGLPWALALVIAVSVFVFLTQTIGRRFKRAMGNNDISFWLISQRMLPPVAVIIPIYILFQRLHLLDTQIGLIIAYCGANLPLAVWFMRDFFETIPLELEESAFIDGATRYQALVHIIIPLSMPGLVATYLITLVFAWNEYTIALFLSETNAQTMPLLVVAQNATRGPQWWNISILVLLMIVPIIVIAIFLERYIAKGLLIGAVKA
ncbi:MAG TPA: carbohydrate ABC transporter permease [Aggregatilineales bacterium]|nr:carbohydrate ABC transporter permease [Aggregatilineales bacterium]